VNRATLRLILLLASIALPMNAVAAEAAAKPAKPPKGHGRYVMVLWEPGTPIPGNDPKQHRKHAPEPDVAKLGGKLLHSKQNQRVIDLPVAAARELRRHEPVVYLQPRWKRRWRSSPKRRCISSGAALQRNGSSNPFHGIR
jgi:hypothetical protein